VATGRQTHLQGATLNSGQAILQVATMPNDETFIKEIPAKVKKLKNLNTFSKNKP
jgi:hypothetical protein